jgi:hypothetical protein
MVVKSLVYSFDISNQICYYCKIGKAQHDVSNILRDYTGGMDTIFVGGVAVGMGDQKRE